MAAVANLRVSMAFFLTASIVLSLALLFTSLQAQAGASSGGGGKQEQGLEEYTVPVRRVVYRTRLQAAAATVETAAAGYEPFELCDGCRCCSAANASSCVDTSCCYAIDCNLPGKPFGTCAFTPQTCGCGDANCTQPS